MEALKVEVWSDIACPWCWVGKRHLEAAIAEFPHEVEVIWRSFELDPSAPKSVDTRVDYIDRLSKKYGVSRAKSQAMIDRMVSVGAGVGLDFRFDRAQPGNTFDAHRLLHWAQGKGRQGALKERLFVAYMHEGRSVAEHEVLVALVDEVGLDPEGARAVLGTDAYAAEVRADEALAAEIGVSGVPFFAFAERYAVPGAQPAAALGKVMQKIWEEAADTCGPEGCVVS